MTEVLFSEKVPPDSRHLGQLSGGAAMEIASFDYFEDNPARTRSTRFTHKPLRVKRCGRKGDSHGRVKR